MTEMIYNLRKFFRHQKILAVGVYWLLANIFNIWDFVFKHENNFSFFLLIWDLLFGIFFVYLALPFIDRHYNKKY